MRRCTSEKCIIKAENKGRPFSIDLPIATILRNPRREWTAITAGNRRFARTVDMDWTKFNIDDYLITHSSIVSSVNVADNGYYIEPPCDELVNANGNSWSTPVLLATFKTFVGGDNFVEHFQSPEASKGKILDAVLRPVVYVGKDGKSKANVMYTDILIATSKKHVDLIESIESGRLDTLSMGCQIDGTKILMADGTQKPIEQVVIGENIRTHKGNVAVVQSTRRRLAESGTVHKLVVSGVPDTYVTKEHPYWSLRGYDRCRGCGDPLSSGANWSLNQIMKQWCSASCYQSHCNSNPKVQNTTTLVEQKVKFDWIPVSHLEVGDYVAIPLGRPYKERPSIDKNRARLIGYFLAEGNYQKHPDGSRRAVEFSFDFNEECADDLISCVRSIGIDDKHIYRQNRIRKNGLGTRICIHSSEIADWLYELCGEYSHSKKLAPQVMEYDDETLLNILGAYINGDGHFRKTDGRITTVSTSQKLSEQIWNLFMLLGISATLSPKREGQGRKKPSWHVVTRKGQASKLASYTSKFVEQKENTQRISSFGGYTLRRVLSNTVMECSYFVNNIHVVNETNDHSFIANGLACHNCIAHWVCCSKCGKEINDTMKNCKHLDNEIMQYFTDENGVRRIVSEMCGRSHRDPTTGKWVGDPKSVTFIEASWVERPAFKGAVVNHFISNLSGLHASEKPTNIIELEAAINDIFKLRVADVGGAMSLRVAKDFVLGLKEKQLIERIARKA